MGIFNKRVNFKPFEYPEVLKYKDAINHSYWLITEWNFISDLQDWKVKLDDVERSLGKNCMLGISQIEISIKRLWAKVGEKIGKAEFEQVGYTFAESEVRHSDAYSKLIDVLGMNDDFSQLMNVPEIQGRVEYLEKYLKGAASNANENFTLTLALFSIFIENVSLFSQFLILRSFNKEKNVLKDIENVVQATQKEEMIHALFGVYLINMIKQENPEWFNEEFYAKLTRACKKACEAELKIIDWLFEAGEPDFIKKDAVKEFVKNRFNESMIMIGAEPVFEVDHEQLKQFKWFDIDIYAETNIDFFNKRPVSYSKKVKPITSEDLF